MPAPPVRGNAAEEGATLAGLVPVIERSPDAIVPCGRLGRLLTWNRSAERLWGWGPSEVLGRPGVDLLFPAHLQPGIRKLAERVLAGETLEDIETEARRRDGLLVPITVNC